MANASRIEGRGAVSKTALNEDPVKGASAKPYVTYTPRSDASPEGELTALANVYRLLLDRRERHDDDLAGASAEKDAKHAK